MLKACERVKANKGAPGVDGMTVDQIDADLRQHRASIYAHIRAGAYIPAPVRRVDIPKPDGGTRILGMSSAMRFTPLRRNEKYPPPL